MLFFFSRHTPKVQIDSLTDCNRLRIETTDSIYFSPFGVPWCGARARVETYITVKKSLLHGSNAPSGADGLFLKPYKVHPLWHKVSTIQHLHSVFTTVGIPKRARDSGSRVWKFWAAIISLGAHKTRLKIYRAHSSTKTPALCDAFTQACEGVEFDGAELLSKSRKLIKCNLNLQLSLTLLCVC